MISLLKSYLAKRPYLVIEWKDELSEAEGWLVINSLKGGAAGGGTRMRKGLGKEEVLSLAKVMEVKFNVCGPAIGGAKSGINFDPSDPRKFEVLRRWFMAVSPYLKLCYGTGGDLNVDEVKDVTPICKNYGIMHPQQGVLQGHYGYSEEQKEEALRRLQNGCDLPVKLPQYSPDGGVGKYNIADMATGYGVFCSIYHFYNIFKKEDIRGKKVIIQGWGNVASAAGYYLAQAGAIIIAIQDKEGGLIQTQGMDFQQVKSLFVNKKGNRLADENILSPEEINERIWNLKADIFVPAAASRIIEPWQINQLIKGGLELISCGANVPYNETFYIYGPIVQEIDSQISHIPDFIANCGMARVFAFLMDLSKENNEIAIFEDISVTIERSLRQIHNQSDSLLNITKNAVDFYIS